MKIMHTRRGSPLALTALAAALLAISGCDILDVENPNNLVEDDLRKPSAAEGVVNGSLALVASAISSIWQPYLVVSDELMWIGSRDAWLSLDKGFISDPFNEFTDAAFPDLGEARWMADEAVEILEEHNAETPTSAMKLRLARAYLYAGVIYTIIAEVQQDFAFSDKREPAPPVGPANMDQVFDDAIARLDKAVSLFTELNNQEMLARSLAMRARAKFSKQVWQKIKPTPNTADPLVQAPGAVQDAKAALALVGPDWRWQFEYSGSTITNSMAAWVNDRAENQFDTTLVTVDPKAVKIITGIKIRDPIDDIPDPVVTVKIDEFTKPAAGRSFAPLTIVDARLLHLIIAEDALARGDVATFTTHINAIRALNPELSPYTGQIPPIEMLKYERRVNTLLMGLRLADMYRFGIREPRWDPGSDAVTAPGTLLPITIVEIRANPFLSGQG